MRKIFCIYTLIVLILVSLVGCSNGKSTNVHEPDYFYDTESKEEDIPASESIQQLTKDRIIERSEDSTDIKFDNYENIDNLIFLAFSFQDSQTQHYGFTIAEQDGDKWKLSYFEDYSNPQDQAVMVTQFVGSNPGETDRKIHITVGYINDEKVKQVVLYYPNQNIIVKQLGAEQCLFLDVNINSSDSLLKLESKSSDGEIIDQKDFG